jgi:hypothetical protein
MRKQIETCCVKNCGLGPLETSRQALVMSGSGVGVKTNVAAACWI